MNAPPPRRVGPFELGATLACGHTAEASLARHAGSASGWDVVLKRLMPHLAGDAEAARGLREEAALLALLPHPPAPRLLAADLDDPSPWLALARAPGLALRPCDPRLVGAPPARLREVFEHLARALASLHAARGADGALLGLAHGDLKPAHFLISEGPSPVPCHVIDYGNARVLGAPLRPEPTGTPAYLAPERHAGAPPSQAADVHALGAMLWEFATGLRHHAAAPETLALALTSAGGLADPILAALAPHPQARPSARDLAAALAAVEVAAPENRP